MALIPEEVITQVLERTDIVETIGLYIPVKSVGRNFKASCPFHNEKTASFTISPDKQIFRCFGCGVAGNIFTFVMKQEHLDFPEAVRMLAAKANVHIPENQERNEGFKNLRQQVFQVNKLAAEYFYKNLLSDKSENSAYARQYLKKRSFTLDTVNQFRLGLALDSWDGLLEYMKTKGVALSLMEKAGLIIQRNNGEGYYDRFRNRIIFPIMDARGNYCAFGARVLEGLVKSGEKVSAKYINSPETVVYTKGKHLYGFYWAKQDIAQNNAAIIVEGYTDCLMPYQAGAKNIVASLGTALTVDQIRLLRRYTKNIYLLFDMDTAGESAMLRSIDILIEEGMNVFVANLDEGEDPDSFIRQNGLESFHKRINESQDFFDYKLDVLKRRYDVKSVADKAQVSQEMITTITKFSNAIVQSEYTKRLARDLNIGEQDIKIELKKAGNNISDRKFPEHNLNKVQPLNVKMKEVDLGILKLLLTDESFITATQEATELSDFQDEKIRNVISKLYDWVDQGKEITVGNLINSFGDEETQQMIASLAIDDKCISGNKEKMHQDYLNRIKQDKLKIKMKMLQEQISMAERKGDHVQLDGFIKEYHLLVKEKV